MSSSQNTFLKFDPNDYDAVFYECDGGENRHALIAFVTCRCPLCDTIVDMEDALEELDSVERKLDQYMEMHEDLVVKVTNHAPELLI